jgi:sugar lactone lactonase YvrE
MHTGLLGVYAHEDSLHQPNDLAITRGGLIFASDPDWSESSGRIWRVDLDGHFSLLEDGMGTTNGIEVSPDERTLYVNESVQRRIWAYDLSAQGQVSRKRLLVEFPDFGLDGMRCDCSGALYVARWGKGVVARVTPDGRVEREISLSGRNCTNLAFGGPDGCTVYVTVADRGNIEWFRVETPGREWLFWAGG